MLFALFHSQFAMPTNRHVLYDVLYEVLFNNPRSGCHANRRSKSLPSRSSGLSIHLVTQ